MRYFYLTYFMALLFIPSGYSQEESITSLQAFKIYNAEGKEVTYKKMLQSVEASHVCFFGELHNNPIAHWLQIELARDLFSLKGDALVMGAEMFESDNQLIINEYFTGHINQSNFEKEMRLWPNYETDYKPLLEFAKENGLRFAATNIPRRYASLVSKEGLSALEKLPSLSKIYMAALPIRIDYSVRCYQEMLKMSEGNELFPQAQMAKDATMAHFIHTNMNETDFFLHFNGSFHSDRKDGIGYYLKILNPDLEISNITVVEQDNINELSSEHWEKADFIICVPTRMTKTY
jgi:uncharacterized iron-regulated protein